MAGVAPAALAGKPRQTKVRVMPWWVPWDNDGDGSVRLLPADTAHTAVVITTDGGTPVPYYETKGFVPLRHAPEKAKKMFAEMQAKAAADARKEGLPVPTWALGAAAVGAPSGADAA